MKTSQAAISPQDLIKLDKSPDGTIKATLERFGKIRIALPRSPLFIEVELVKTGKGFVTQVTTGVEGNDKTIAAAKKANNGKEPGYRYHLALDGKFKSAAGKKPGDKAVGDATGATT